jgi:hypothetical protein
MMTRLILLASSVSLVGGCALFPPVRAGVPEGATLTQEAGVIMSYTPREAGMIYVRDPSEDLIVARVGTWAGQRVDVNARENWVRLDGKPVETYSPLRPDRNYQIYFLASGGIYQPVSSPP